MRQGPTLPPLRWGRSGPACFPKSRRGVPLIGALLNPNYPDAASQLPALEQAARTIGRGLFVAKASNDEELNAAFALLLQQGIGALLVAADAYFDTRRDRIIAFAAQNRLP